MAMEKGARRMTREPGRPEAGRTDVAAYVWILALSIGLALGALIGPIWWEWAGFRWLGLASAVLMATIGGLG